MKPILEQLAMHLAEDPGKELGSCRIILPNRRAVLFLRHHLARHVREVSWAPEIQSINDFVVDVSLLEPADPIQMHFLLHEVYEKCVREPEPLDEFYYWGEIMLRDFDEIDKYLVDARMLFRNLADMKDLEDPMAGMDEAQVAFIRRFWSGFTAGENTPEKKKFLAHWELLPRLYDGLREKLAAGGTGYQGMLYREVAERISSGACTITGGERTIIAGFNALNGCEKKIFHRFRSLGARFYWDHDTHYTKDRHSEAGRFIVENLRQFPAYTNLDSFDHLSEEKAIRIFELPSDVLQAKIAGRILSEEGPSRTADCTDTALVLCDEELLMPVVMSLPGSPGEVNITMGYPMKNTPVFTFIDHLLRNQESLRGEKDGSVRFYHRDVIALLTHPYMAEEEPGGGDHPLSERIASENLMYVEREMFTGPLSEKVFRGVEHAGGMIAYFREVFLAVLNTMAGEVEGEHFRFDREFIFQLLVQLNKLENLMEACSKLTSGMVTRLLRKVLSILRVPFEGEPLSGIQVMGILETRLLDFRHVIVLSLNEEVMPGSGSAQSFIPYSLRLAFGMPAKEDMDAIYAYYFYRLLQRAEKIDLIYNSGAEGLRTGEMSRYLYQLIFDRGIRVIRPGMDVAAKEIRPVSVQRTAGIMEKLHRYLASDGGGRYLSPSAINAYIDCPLRFYLRHLAGIGEPDRVEEELDAAGFGTVVHETIHRLYCGIADDRDGAISRVELAALLKGDRPGEVLEKVFLSHHFHGRRNAVLAGRNIIIYRVMLKYLRRIMETDLTLASFRIVDAERAFTREMEITTGGADLTVRLGGKIDRIDLAGEELRVIDYKTGQAGQSFPSIDALFDGGSSSRNRAAMQVLLYAWLAEPASGDRPILPGLYIMRELYSEHFDPGLYLGGKQRGRRIDSFGEVSREFEERLRRTIESIFDPEGVFGQTDNEAHCRSCDFAAICNRSTLNG